jgi:hypothetical protein
MLNLKTAIETDRLKEFIAQEEARGIGASDWAEIDRALARAIKAPQSADQTSRSSSGDSSSGKRTR